MRQRTEGQRGAVIVALFLQVLSAAVATAADTPFTPRLIPQMAHSEGISSAIVSEDARVLATTAPDKAGILIWQASTGRLLRALRQEGPTTLISMSLDGHILASVSEVRLSSSDYAYRVSTWDVAHGVLIHEDQSHSTVLSIAVSPDGRWVARARLHQNPESSKPGERREVVQVEVWDAVQRAWACRLKSRLSDDQWSREVMASHFVHFSRDGQFLIAADFPPFFGGSAAVTRWAVRGWKREAAWSVKLPAQALAPSPSFAEDGRLLVASWTSSNTSGIIPSDVPIEKGIVVWDVATGAVVYRLSGDWCGWDDPLVLSADGRFLATSGCYTLSERAAVWDLQTRKKLCTLDAQHSMSLTADGRWLVTAPGGKSVALWDTATGRRAREFGGVALSATAAVDDQGRWLAISNADRIDLWDTRTGAPVRALRLPQEKRQTFVTVENFRDPVFPQGAIPAERTRRILPFVNDARDLARDWIHMLAFVPNGGGLVATYDRSNTAVWDLATMRPGTMLPSARWVSVSPDGRLLALAANDAHPSFDHLRAARVTVWEPERAAIKATFKREGDLTGVSFASNDSLLITSEVRELWGRGDVPEVWSGGDVDFWRTVSRQGSRVWLEGFQKDLLWKTPADGVHGFQKDLLWKSPVDGVHRVGGVAWTRILRVHGDDGVAWTRTLHAGTQSGGASAASRHGRRMAVALADVIVVLDDSGNSTAQLPCKECGRLSSLAISNDGSRLAAAGSDGRVWLWRADSTLAPKPMYAHENEVRSIAFSHDGRFLWTSSDDGTVKLGDVENQQELATLASLKDSGDWLVTTPDGLFDGTVAGWQKLIWRFSDSLFDTLPVEAFFNEYYYPGLLGDLLSGRRPQSRVASQNVERRQPEVALRITQPSSADAGAAAREETEVEISIDIKQQGDEGAKDLRLFRNGLLVQAWRGSLLASASSNTFKATARLMAGDNVFTAYCFNRDNVKSSDAKLSVRGSDSLQRRGTLWIVTVGINEYSNRDYNLRYASADAVAFDVELRARQATLGRFEAIEYASLLDGDATKANILLALRRLGGVDGGALPPGAPAALRRIGSSRPEDVVFVYFAGHGTAQGPRYYLLPHDIGYSGPRTALGAADLATILEHSISDEELEQVFEGIDAGSMTLIIDACNSGQALDAEEKRRGPMNSRGLAQLAYEKGINILTASQGYQAALEAGQLGHGYLTYALVQEGLKTTNADRSPRDGNVDLREWLDYATQRVPEMQMAMIQTARKEGRELTFAENEVAIGPTATRGVQRPRVFYRREPETEPLVIARTARATDQ